MKQLFIQLNAAILLLLSFSFHCMGADNYTLEYNLEKGKTYNQNMVSVTNMKMNTMGQDINMVMTMEMGFQYDVLGLNNGVYDVRTSYRKIKSNMSSPMMSLNIDSDSPENSTDKALGDIFKSLTGVPIDLQLTKQGKVISVKGIEKLVEKINAISNPQYKMMVDQQFSEKAIKATFEQMAPYFPSKPVAIGDSWDVNTTVNSSGFDIISKMKVTLKQVKDNIATLDCTGTLTTPEGGAVINVQGMDAKASIKGNQVGNILMDMKTGWITRSEINQKFDLDMEIMGQTMQQKIETKVTVTAD